MYSSYLLKDKFQKLLMPLMYAAVKLKLSANTITITSFLVSLIYVAALGFYGTTEALIVLPLVLFIKVALNALDGMVARFTHSISPAGSALNDICDVMSDVLLFSAVFVMVTENLFLWFALVILIFVIEYSALVVLSITHQRPTDGPFGKSDRAIFLGFIALAIAVGDASPSFIIFSLGVAILLAIITLYNRLKRISQCQDS